MTAPAAAVESAPEVFETAEQAMASITSEAVKQTLTESPEPVEDTPARDTATGRFTPREKPDGEVTADGAMADVVAAQGEPLAEVTPEPVVLPDGFVAVPKIEGRELATPFSVHDKDGEMEVPDLLIKYTANGKERTDSLDKVVKMAQFGVYNHEREQQVQSAKAEVQQTQSQMQQLVAYAQKLEAERERLLTDDETYLTTRAKYEQENTPEARLQKEQVQLQQQQNQHAFNQASSLGEQFYTTELAPSVETILKALPTVSLEEIGAKLLLVTDQYKMHTPFGSIIPPKAYAAVRQAIAQEVVPWAQQLHFTRDAERQTTTRQTDAEKLALQKAAEKAQVESQKSKNLLGKGLKPGAGKASKDTPQPKPIKTLQDAEDSALHDTLAAMGMG